MDHATRSRIEHMLTVSHGQASEAGEPATRGFAAGWRAPCRADDPWWRSSARWFAHTLGDTPPDQDGATLDAALTGDLPSVTAAAHGEMAW